MNRYKHILLHIRIYSHYRKDNNTEFNLRQKCFHDATLHKITSVIFNGSIATNRRFTLKRWKRFFVNYIQNDYTRIPVYISFAKQNIMQCNVIQLFKFIWNLKSKLNLLFQVSLRVKTLFRQYEAESIFWNKSRCLLFLIN